jgi:hypothetical protein
MYFASLTYSSLGEGAEVGWLTKIFVKIPFFKFAGTPARHLQQQLWYLPEYVFGVFHEGIKKCNCFLALSCFVLSMV